MALKRTRKTRNTMRKRARTQRGRASTLRRAVQPLHIKRTFYNGSWTFGTATTNDFWRYYAFTTAQINNFGEMAAVFDEYRINGIKVTFRPRYDSVDNLQTSGTLTQPQAYAHYLVDPASTLLPSGVYGSSSLNTFLENQGVRTRTLNRPFSIFFKPKVQDQVLGGSTASRTLKPTWLKTTETGVDHRGFHIYLQQNAFSTGNTNIVLDIYFTFYMSLKNLK